MANLINGKELAEKIKDKVAQGVYDLQGKRPNLAIILVGDREDSKLYVRLKEEEAKKVGIDTHLYKFESDASEQELIDTIKFLNQDSEIDAILVQLPLPNGLDSNKIIDIIDPAKDVDGFHPKNIAAIRTAEDYENYIPPLIKVVMEMLESINFVCSDKRACLLVNSDIFGEPLASLLEKKKMAVEIVKTNDPALSEKTVQSDLLVTALGQPHFITQDMVKQGATIIDIGITKVEGKSLGDVDFEDVKDKADYITPVPGGVGPMTIALVLEKTLELYKKKNKK